MPRKKLPKTRNKFEARIDQQLRAACIAFSYESAKIPYVIAGHYIPDFIIETKTGKVYLETKGHFRPEAKRKMAAVKKMHPELDIRIIFYSRSKPNVRWAEKHGFKYAFHSVPDDWIDGF
jgi:predicted nuclease of restriction endonuclease-like RecB superfamily